MKKRGELTLKPVVELSFAAMVILAFLLVAYRFGTQEFYVQAKIAREGAASANIYQDISGNAWLTFPSSTQSPVILQNNLFQVGDALHSFVGNVIQRRLEKTSAFYIYKDGKDISIASEKPKLKKFDCPDTKFSSINTQLLITEETKQIADSFFFRDNPCTREGRCAADNSLVTETPSTLLKFSPMSDDGIVVRYPSDSEESKQFACAFANELNVENIWILPTRELLQGQRSVLVEVGGSYNSQITKALQEVFS